MELCTVSQVKDLLLKHAAGFQDRDSVLFQAGNQCLPRFVKRGIVRDIDTEESSSVETSSSRSNNSSIDCNVPGCLRKFDTTLSYEAHYNTQHRYGCSVCHKTMPSAHLLDLHLQESHDSFFAVQAERRPMFACYVEECQHKSKDAKERRDHCIRHHRFPHDFRFDIPPKQKSMAERMETDEVKKEIPKTFHFGHNSSKTFTRPKKSILDTDTLMDDLKASLPNT